MTERTYPPPDQRYDYFDLIEVRDAQDVINGVPRIHAIADGETVKISRDGATDDDLDAVHVRCMQRIELLRAAEALPRSGRSVNQHFDEIVRAIKFEHNEQMKVARRIAASVFHTAFDADLNDVTEWCAHKHGINNLLIDIEQHISCDHYCDLALCNAYLVKPRELRVAMRGDARIAMKALGYCFDYRPGFDIEPRSFSSRSDRMSGHERLRAISRIEAAVK